MKLSQERLKELAYSAGLEPCDSDPVYDSVMVGEVVAMAKEILSQRDYFGLLVSKARDSANKAMVKFPQPNYVLNKVSEEHGEVIKAVVHYLEGRETWENVEGELVDNLAMLIRLVVEGDGVIGFTPPERTKI